MWRFFATLMSVFIALLYGWLAVFLRDHPVDVKGRGVVVRVPLRVCAEWHDKVLGMRNQRRLREMLRTVPVYDELLTQYPNATITVIGHAFI